MRATRTDSSVSAERQESPRSWVKNFAALFACQLFAFASFGAAMPFIPLYLRELGEDERGAVIWAGVIQAVSSAFILVATPLWGAVSDRFGRKPMVVRAMASGAISLGLMAFATHAWHVLVLRTVQGATAGTTAAVMALAAGVLPINRLGMGMGLLQTAQFLGSALGPLLGGLASAQFGFRGSFMASAAASLGVAGLVSLVVREPAQRAASSAGPPASLKERLVAVMVAPQTRAPILGILAFQASWAVSFSLLPLHVAALADTGAEGTAAVGVVLTSNALGVAAGATALGWLGGRVGEHRLALAALVCTSLLTLPQTWLITPLAFVPLRFALGFCAGGVLPSLRAELGQQASRDRVAGSSLGALYGLAQSAFAGGMVVGPPIASLAASTLGLPSVHVVSAVLMLITAGWLGWAMRAPAVREG